MRWVALLSCVCLGWLHGNAAAASEQSHPSLDTLEFMTGCWQGEGWSRQRTEVKKFKGRELVEFKAGRTVIAITGRHFDLDTGSVVHDAFAIVSRAKEGTGYRFTSFLGSGQSGEFPAALKDGAFVWEMPIPNSGTVRYTIRIAEDAWQKSGHFSPDGQQWHEMFGMTLKRIKSGDSCFR